MKLFLLGPIPSDFASLKNLQLLYLGDNQLTGTIPKFLGSLSFLTYLWLEKNKFTGKTNTFFLYMQLEFVNLHILFNYHYLTHFRNMCGNICLVKAIIYV